MKHMKTVQVPAQEKQVIDKVTCDLCNVEIKRSQYSAEGVEVKHRTGNSYPEGGSGQEIAVDLCGKCFDEKLIPWLRDQGATLEWRGWDY